MQALASPQEKVPWDIPYIEHFLILNMYLWDNEYMNLNPLLMNMFLLGMVCKLKM